MYKMFMTTESLDFVRQALLYLASEVGQVKECRSFWVCYGSFVLNQQTSDSDLDLLYIHDQTSSVRRIQSSFRGHQVTIYSISKNDFINDGELRMFGGYFAGKILNPHVVFQGSETDRSLILDTASKYIAPFAEGMYLQQKRKEVNRFNMVADSVMARLYICPWYHSYFLRYYINPDFLRLWNRMEEVICSAFVKSGVIIQDGETFMYRHGTTVEDLHAEAIKVSARFWSLGNYLHNSRFDFSDYYIQKSEQFIVKNNLEEKCLEMLAFLKCGKKGGEHEIQ